MLQAYLTESPSTPATESIQLHQQAVAELEALEAHVLRWLHKCCRGFGLFGALKLLLPTGAPETLEPDHLKPANHALLGKRQRTWLETFWSGELAQCLINGFGAERQLKKEEPPFQLHQSENTVQYARNQHCQFLDRLGDLLSSSDGASLLREVGYQPHELVEHVCAGRPFSHDQVFAVWRHALLVLLLFMSSAGSHQARQLLKRALPNRTVPPSSPSLVAASQRLDDAGILTVDDTSSMGCGSLRQLSWKWSRFVLQRSHQGEQLELDSFQRSLWPPHDSGK